MSTGLVWNKKMLTRIWSGNLKRRGTLGDLGINVWIILKLIL
jgi:hypothetical protein